ncbi:membrane protein insertion efficiency factor YidD [Staphylococcus pettenkoferi]|uniref:membrane protein insertion efficiency factor YidD n=1 Tax=Staphylococcus pettenkoferi TaxID=170573 RepID=UPI002273A688|nr:membrane protein insertion efficiency factor YidD [Staphylococcus pettenkoferi]MCY1579656.1 membrane protein insertion efficiency factor YidD [Staphylococcus pettenkoferi]
MKKVFLALIHFYQHFISPMTPRTCRFYPTCSEYTREAIEVYGPIKGLWLGIKRISKCHPFHKSGFDPVPLKKDHKNHKH